MKPLSIGAALAAALCAGVGVAHASTLTFDAGLDSSQLPFAPYLTHGAPLYQDGFQISARSSVAGAGEFDLVGALVDGSDLGASCAAIVCPTNNASTFLLALDDSAVYLSSAAGAMPFTLGGFSASFVGNGLDPVATRGAAGIVRVFGVLADGSGLRIESFALAPASQDGQLSFSSYVSSFADTPLTAVVFQAFSCDAQGVCNEAIADNRAQFALDDIAVSAVPEPANWCMAVLGLLALGLTSRRRAARATADCGEA